MTEYWIWLTKLKGIGPVLQHKLLEYFENPKNIYEATYNDYLYVQGMGTAKARNIENDKNLDAAKHIVDSCKKNGIRILTYHSLDYPDRLKPVSDFPIILYYKGDIDLLKHEMTAVVGARRCSREVKDKIIEIVEEKIKENNIIISGMAKGVDGYAHTACLKAGGKTVAVLGNGLDICYPKEHDILMQRIEESGLLLSEYEPGVNPTRYTFPMRNQIIAALANTIMIPEAHKGSGSYITAEYAVRYGRDIVICE